MKQRALLIGILTAVLFLNPAAGFGLNNLTLDSYLIIEAYWEKLETWYQVEEYPFEKISEIGELEQAYIAKARRYRALCEEMASTVLKAMEKGDPVHLFALSTIYKELEPVQKRALDPIVPIIVEKITTDAVNESGELISLIPEEHRENLYHEYFPGYGEGDHHYRYRKGRETKREFLSSFWKTEQEVIESTEYREMVIKASLLSQLEAQVECLKVLKLFEIEINGQIVAAAKVSFQLKHSLITECRRMYANNKIWFELWRKDKLDLWGDEYELCGETYEFKEEPAGEESSITTGLLN